MVLLAAALWVCLLPTAVQTAKGWKNEGQVVKQAGGDDPVTWNDERDGRGAAVALVKIRILMVGGGRGGVLVISNFTAKESHGQQLGDPSCSSNKRLFESALGAATRVCHPCFLPLSTQQQRWGHIRRQEDSTAHQDERQGDGSRYSQALPLTWSRCGFNRQIFWGGRVAAYKSL
jgi:hypothetical protein